MCDCWMEKGVKRVGRCQYRCAGCGADISDVFLMAAVADEAFADDLIERGSFTTEGTEGHREREQA